MVTQFAAAFPYYRHSLLSYNAYKSYAILHSDVALRSALLNPMSSIRVVSMHTNDKLHIE